MGREEIEEGEEGREEGQEGREEGRRDGSREEIEEREEGRGGEGGGCCAAWLTEVLLCFRHLLSTCRTGTMSSVPPRTLSKTHYYSHFATPITEA